jgi:hypothetical protein
MSACWVAVASAEHVRRGRREGFMQVSHGKAAPLKRIKPGDRVVYYSPTVTLGGNDKLQGLHGDRHCERSRALPRRDGNGVYALSLRRRLGQGR